MDQLFTSFVEKSLERVPLLEIRERREIEGVKGEVTHTLFRNIFTSFDASLSQHMSAIKGEGLSAITITTKFSEGGEPLRERLIGTGHFRSLPHGLCKIAKDALGTHGNAALEIAEMPREIGNVQRRAIGPEDLTGLEQALKVADWFGRPEFCPLSGDFDVVMLEPLGGSSPVLIDLYKGSVSIPCGSDRYEAPIFGFADYVKEHPALRAFLASVRHSQIEAKQDAVLAFRAMAEDRIMRFDHALRGNALEYHRLHAAMSLVARLRVGLGDDLSGLSEDAQITALDWSAVIERESRGDRRQSSPLIRDVHRPERMRA
ncbi:MAG: hypothetical protein AAF501_17840 [Pseudomonadota bacterium]